MPDTQRQVRYAHAILSGKARKKSMPRRVAEEIVSEMHGKRLGGLPRARRAWR